MAEVNSFSGGSESDDDARKPAAMPDSEGCDAEPTDPVNTDADADAAFDADANADANADADTDPVKTEADDDAYADEAEKSYQQGNLFILSDEVRKNAKGNPLCRAAGCEKTPTTSTNICIGKQAVRFCKTHHNGWVIHTGQVGFWDCECGNRVLTTSARCGKCHCWREGKAPISDKKKNKKTHVPDDSGLQISTARKRNDKGRILCMVVGCCKLEQSSSEGFCRVHFKIFAAVKEANNRLTDDGGVCGLQLSAVRRKNDKGRTLCKVLGCEKLDQARSDGFCRMHFTLLSVVGGKKNELTDVPADSICQISQTPRKNDKGRTLCKVLGCSKLDQARSDGFCRMHFNTFSVSDVDGDGAIDSQWTCACGNLMSGKNKRCGECNKWRGGKRDPYNVPQKKMRTLTDAMDNELVDHWTCVCGNELPATKARCGSCHHWRGGKRKGGWKIKPFCKNDDVDDGINWDQDWSCCGVLIPAKKVRCAQCHSWREGKRVPKSRLEAGSSVPNNDGPAEEEHIQNC